MLRDLPVFPNMEPLELSLRPLIQGFSNLFPKPNSDLNFVSLWCFMNSHCTLARLHDNLVFKLLDYHDQSPYYTFLGTHKIAQTAETIVSHALRQSYSPRLRSIHEDIVNRIDGRLVPERFVITHDRDFDDYILDIEGITLLKGRIYADRKREVNHFFAQYPSYTLKQINLSDASIQTKLRHIFQTWASQNTGKMNAMEATAFERALQHAEDFGLEAFGLYVKDAIVSFIITEPLHDGYIMSHFAKSDYDFRFSYTALVHLVARAYSNRGYKYLNFQQDLGIGGLRKYKYLWRPLAFTKKYFVSCKQQ